MNEMIQNNDDLMPAVQNFGGIVGIEQSRAVAEVQASIVLAKANPRNEMLAEKKILSACKRQVLAEGASYSFKRGGEVVTGPSIRLAEVLARYWGNLNYGFREIGRGADYSEIEAFAYDFETNVKVSRTFQIKHWRDKKNGGAAITAERDKYEHVASHAQRRVRACLLEIIPGDIVEMAEEACKATLVQSIGNIDEKIKQILDGFAKLGVTQAHIEAYLQRSIRSIVPADVVMLQRIFRSIRDGVAAPAEFFEMAASGAENINKKFGEKKPEAKVEDRVVGPPVEKQKKPDPPAAEKPVSQPATKATEEIIPPKVLAEMDEIANKATMEAVDAWAFNHHNRIQKQYGEKWAKLLMHQVESRRCFLRGEVAPGEEVKGVVVDQDETGELLRCPEAGGREALRSDCELSECSKMCPAFLGKGASKLQIEV